MNINSLQRGRGILPPGVQMGFKWAVNLYFHRHFHHNQIQQYEKYLSCRMWHLGEYKFTLREHRISPLLPLHRKVNSPAQGSKSLQQESKWVLNEELI